MDELEMLIAARPEYEVPPETTARHRRDLLSLIAAEAESSSAESAGGAADTSATLGPRLTPTAPRWAAHSHRRRPRRIATAALSIVIVTTGTLVATRWAAQRPGDGQVSSSALTNSQTTGPPGSGPACGVISPLDLRIPSAFTGPNRGTAPDSRSRPDADQLVLSWSAPASSIEMRWPADEPLSHAVPAQAGPPESADNAMVLIGGPGPNATLDPDGRYSSYIVYRIPALPRDCQTVQFSVVAPTASELASIIGTLRLMTPVTGGQLVVEVQSRTNPPDVAPCRAPAGASAPPARTEDVATSSTYGTPADALTAFLATQPTFARRGYVQMNLPDGSVAYGQPSDGDSFVTVVRVASSAAGWTVRSWAASGC